MNSSFKTFLNHIGLEALRPLSTCDENASDQEVLLSALLMLCRERATGRLVTAKMWPAASEGCAHAEAMALAELCETGFVPQLGVLLRPNIGPVLIRGFLPGRTLADSQAGLSEEQTAQLAGRLRLVMNAIHLKGWVHRDLTPNNILLTAPLQPIIIDWDLAEKISFQNQSSFHPRGTPGFSFTSRGEGSIEEDLAALEKVIDFLGPCKKNVKRKSWFEGLFSARL